MARILTVEEQRCLVCGYQVWGPIWLEDKPPPATCMDGAATVTDCETALGKAHITATLIRARVKLPGVQ